MAYGDGNRGKGKGLAFLLAHVSYKGDDCILWPYSRGRGGYGQFSSFGKFQKAHSWMCEAIHADAPPDKPYAAHECGNGHLGCITPKHLFWKSQDENAKDSIKHGT